MSVFGSLVSWPHAEPVALREPTVDVAQVPVGRDRRRAQRLAPVPGSAGTTATGHLFELLNISADGLLLRSTHPIRAGERHVLRLPDPDLGSVTLAVTVIHVTSVIKDGGRFVVAGVTVVEPLELQRSA